MPRIPTNFVSDVLSVAEASRRLEMHPDTYKKGIRMGVLPGVAIDTKYVVPKQWFDRFLVGDWTPQPRNKEAA